MDHLGPLNLWVPGICCLKAKGGYKIRFYDDKDISKKTKYNLDQFKEVTKPNDDDRELSLIPNIEGKAVIKLRLPTEQLAQRWYTEIDKTIAEIKELK